MLLEDLGLVYFVSPTVWSWEYLCIAHMDLCIPIYKLKVVLPASENGCIKWECMWMHLDIQSLTQSRHTVNVCWITHHSYIQWLSSLTPFLQPCRESEYLSCKNVSLTITSLSFVFSCNGAILGSREFVSLFFLCLHL